VPFRFGRKKFERKKVVVLAHAIEISQDLQSNNRVCSDPQSSNLHQKQAIELMNIDIRVHRLYTPAHSKVLLTIVVFFPV
jgi:hypothetical protein